MDHTARKLLLHMEHVKSVCLGILEKIKAIREAEGLSQEAFADEIGMKLRTLRNYEQGLRETIASSELLKITTHPRFEKYAMWLVTGKTAPKAGQISPDIEQRRTA